MYKTLANRSIIRFAAVGLTSTIIDILLLNLFGLVLNVYIATGIGFVAGATNGYILNSMFVFKKEKSTNRFTKYFLISLSGLALTEVIIHYVHVDFGLRLNAAKLVAVGIVFFWNYGWSKFWAFK